jgi:hypothetical protein
MAGLSKAPHSRIDRHRAVVLGMTGKSVRAEMFTGRPTDPLGAVE